MRKISFTPGDTSVNGWQLDREYQEHMHICAIT